jgi:uncharacterized phosphatase
MTTTICIIRHGETEWNASGRLQGCEDIEINDLGRKQAIQVAQYLKNEPWDIIISSPLKRALETAQIIGRIVSVSDILVWDRLKERNYGEAAGLLPEERHQRFPDGVVPGQEDFESLRVRAYEALCEMVRTYSGKKMLVVSHGAYTNSILYTLSHGTFGSFKTRLKNGCINLLQHNDQLWTVVFYNKTSDELQNQTS